MGFYKLDVELEKILQASFPKPEDVNKIRQLFAEDLKKDMLGVGSYYKENIIHPCHNNCRTEIVIAQPVII